MPAIIHIKETSSTNLYLKQLILEYELEDGTIVATNNQTAGRGQRGNSWESEEGKNLTFSMLLHPHFVAINEQFVISQIVSIAIKEVLDKYTTEITIKWPNDIYWNEKKICGILIENTLYENKIANCIIGIGLNINQEKFVSEAPNPTSLKLITNTEHTLEDILQDIQNNILKYYQELQSNKSKAIAGLYQDNLFRKNGYYLYSDGETEFEAKIKNIEPNGLLVLETREGDIRKFAFKEVRYIL